MAGVLDEDLELAKAVRADFEAGVLSLREIATRHSTPGRSFSHVTLANYAESAGWTRSLSKRIKAKAEEKVQRTIAREQNTALNEATERQVIEANAERIAQVRSEHRADIKRAREIVLRLMTELEGQKKLIDCNRTVKTMTESLRNVIDLEREAYGILRGAPPEEQPGAGSDDAPIDVRELARGMAFLLSRAVIEKAQA